MGDLEGGWGGEAGRKFKEMQGSVCVAYGNVVELLCGMNGLMRGE